VVVVAPDFGKTMSDGRFLFQKKSERVNVGVAHSAVIHHENHFRRRSVRRTVRSSSSFHAVQRSAVRSELSNDFWHTMPQSTTKIESRTAARGGGDSAEQLAKRKQSHIICRAEPRSVVRRQRVVTRADPEMKRRLCRRDRSRLVAAKSIAAACERHLNRGKKIGIAREKDAVLDACASATTLVERPGEPI